MNIAVRFAAAWAAASGFSLAFAAQPAIDGCSIFPASNAWNTPVDQLPLHPSSALWVQTIGPTRNLHPDFGTFYLGAPIGIPFASVPGTQPNVPVIFQVDDESDPSPYPIPADAPIEGGSASDGDRHVLVLQREACVLHELFHSFPVGGGTSWTAYSGARFALGSNALRPDTWTSADAAGLPILPGLVRFDEAASGEIRHALRFTASRTRKAHIWPARHDASSLTGAQYPPIGARFRLKAGFDISGFSPRNQVILRALKKYGMILADNGSDWFISGAHDLRWDDASLGQLKSLRGSDFEAVDSERLRIDPESAKALQAPPDVALREVVRGLDNPVEIAHAGDGSGRLFVLEMAGRIRIVRNGTLVAAPFLDISGRIAAGGESGLLGLAFHPDFHSNRRFFVFYTLPDGSLRVSSFLASASDPDLAEPASELAVITIPHPTFGNHNGGKLAFGPNGYLYIATGDGGSGGDPFNNAQNLGSLLGKILRIDVNAAGGYRIPPTNPLAGMPGARPEIWHYGLRNPWRFSFDRETGDLYIGDVGQGAVEEVNFVPAGAPGPLNFGWRVLEGSACYNPPSGCGLARHTPPVLEYLHDAQGGLSVTGGYVYRGTRSASLRGYYFYGDFSSGRVWAAPHEGTGWAPFAVLPLPNGLAGISTFGEGQDGELYVASFVDGRIYAIDGPADMVAPSRNFARAAEGSTATASTTGGSAFPPSSLVDGDRRGLDWGAGGGWKDGTAGAYPDWVEIDFGADRGIDRVVVYSLQDDPGSPAAPVPGSTFTAFGATRFSVEGWDGSQWVALGSVAGNLFVGRGVDFPLFTTRRIRINVEATPSNHSRLVEVEAWGPVPGVAPPANVALASNGGVATSSSSGGTAFPVSSLIDGDRAGLHWGAGGGWKDGTANVYPDWVQVDFDGTKEVSRVVVFSLQDSPASPAQPGDSTTFAAFGATAFTVQGWSGSAWLTLATVAGNNLVKRSVDFAPFATDRIRVNIDATPSTYSRLVEIEAYASGGAPPPSPSINVALASNGASASASSDSGGAFPVASVIDGDRKGLNWGYGGGWKDGTASVYPDWVQVDFGASHPIDRVVVVSLQDAPMNPVEPGDATTFTAFGATSFAVEAWTGSAWVAVASVTGNNLVKRAVPFPPVTTDRVRVSIVATPSSYSRLVEVEAWTPAVP